MSDTIKILKHPHLLALIITLVFCVFILPINEQLAFNIPTDKKLFAISGALKLGFGLFLYTLSYLCVVFFLKVYQGYSLYRSWLRWSVIYLFIMGVLFLLTYPGHWVWDEFNILNSVKSYIPDAWQNYLTNIFYTFSLYLFPTGVSIVVFQMIFSATVVGYVISRLSNVYGYRFLPYIILCIFCLPPILLNDLYPLRLTIYTYIEIFFITRLVLLYKQSFTPHNKYKEIIILTVCVGLLSFWRSEGIYYLLVIPILFATLKIFSKQNFKDFRPYLSSAICLVVLLLLFTITKITSDSKYILASAINPLSIVIQQPLKGKNVARNLDAVDKVIDLDIVRKYPSFKEVPSFWMGAIRPDYKEHLTEFKTAYTQLVIDNIDLFAKAKVKTFLSTNGFYESTPTPIGLLLAPSHSNPLEAYVASRFHSTNYFSEPFNYSLKENTTKLLLMVNEKNEVTSLGRVIWTVIPSLLLLAGFAVLCIVKRWWFWLSLILLVFARTIIVFLTSPANYFMYYLPVYATGNLIILLLCVEMYKKTRRTVSSRES